MESNRIYLGKRIKYLRKGRNLSQEQLADMVGVIPKYISRLEMGNGTPSFEVLEKISSSLNVMLKDLFNFDGLQETVTKEMLLDIFNGLDEERRRLLYKILKCFV